MEPMTIDSIHAVVAALEGGFPDAEVQHFPDDNDRGYCFSVGANGRIVGVLVVTFGFLADTLPDDIDRRLRRRAPERRLKPAGRRAEVLLTTQDVRVC